MSTHLPPEHRDPNKSDASAGADPIESNNFMTLHQSGDPASRKAGYELADANVRDTAVFLAILGASLAVVFVLAFGIGKLIFMELGREDGPANKWSQMSGVTPGNFVSDSEIQQQQLQQMIQKFPTPRVQTDDGEMEVAEMHAREDILLNHYSWVDEQKQTVRIPIMQAMELVAQRGLPVEGQTATNGKQSIQTDEDKPMFGDGSNVVTAPLTDGFARTGPELQIIDAREQRIESGTPTDAHAELNTRK